MYLVSFLFSVILIAASCFQRPLFNFRERALISPPPKLEYFSFGYQNQIADSLWIRAIQDFDYCEKVLAKHLCQGNGWLSAMLDTITNLAPDYEVAYLHGGLALTIIVSDYPGASKIFDKGVRVYPSNRKLVGVAAYHALYEERDSIKAARLYKQAADNGAPSYYYNLAARLYLSAGKKEGAEQLFEELKKSGIELAILKRMKEKIDATK